MRPMVRIAAALAVVNAALLGGLLMTPQPAEAFFHKLPCCQEDTEGQGFCMPDGCWWWNHDCHLTSECQKK